uniref:Uncharacterized protein n=1 Tax=Xanthomonas citri pv. phaseoli var. fuscans TaxID=473423 RepID=A0AB33F4Y1_XANCI
MPRIKHQARHAEQRAQVIEVGAGGEGQHRLLRLVVGSLAQQQLAGCEQLQDLVDRIGFGERRKFRQQPAKLGECLGEDRLEVQHLYEVWSTEF